MKKPFIRCALGAAAGAFAIASQAAIVSPGASVTIDGWAFGSGNNVHLTSSVGPYNGQAGGFKGSLSGAGALDTATLLTYCVELTESFSHWGAPSMLGYTYVDALAHGEWAHAAQTADNIGRLMTYVKHNPTAVDTAAESTSLQLAIWNLIYDTDFTVTAHSGSGFDDSSAYAGYADTLLGQISATASEYRVGVLTLAGSQDFLMLTPSGTDDHATTTVPEPQSLPLAALAMLAAVAAGSRRRARH